MLILEKLLKNKRAFQATTGFKEKEFRKLLRSFVKEEEELALLTYQGKERVRTRGGGDKPMLMKAEERLLFILVYFKAYPTQDLQGVLFEMTQPAAFKWIHKLTPLLEKALGRRMELPARPVNSLAELERRCPDLLFIIDGTERPIRRPKCSERQSKCYSGKKKRHSLKNTVVSSAKTKKIILLGNTREGTVHDKRLAEEDGIRFPKNSTLLKDTGYQGYEPEGVNCLQPKKRTKNRDLSERDKEFNRGISSVRVRVEHSIGGFKRNRIASDIYRNRRKGFDDKSMLVSCGLYNFTVSCRNLGR